MPELESLLRSFHDRFDAIEKKLDSLAHRVEHLMEKLELGEDWPLRNMPRPGNMNEVPHMPGLG